jgi:hypothetical protein
MSCNHIIARWPDQTPHPFVYLQSVVNPKTWNDILDRNELREVSPLCAKYDICPICDEPINWQAIDEMLKEDNE